MIDPRKLEITPMIAQIQQDGIEQETPTNQAVNQETLTNQAVSYFFNFA
jgi:hypothetical protein